MKFVCHSNILVKSYRIIFRIWMEFAKFKIRGRVTLFIYNEPSLYLICDLFLTYFKFSWYPTSSTNQNG